MTLAFQTATLAVSRTATEFSIGVNRPNGTGAASVNVRAGSPPDYTPAAQNYDGMERDLYWGAGETGIKTATFPVVQAGYILLTLNNPTEPTIEPSRCVVHIHEVGATPYFHADPLTENHAYVRTTEAATIVVPLSQLVGGGTAPPPAPGAEQTIEGVSNPGANIDIVPQAGLQVTGDNTAKTITISLPPGTDATPYLKWNSTTGAYEPAALPETVSDEPFTGTITGDGTSTEFIVTHNQDIAGVPDVSFMDAQSNEVFSNWRKQDANTIVVSPNLVLAAGTTLTLTVRK